MDHKLLYISLAIVADWAVGDPPKWPHMVRYMGRWIEVIERVIRRISHDNPRMLLAGGAVMWVVVAGGWGGIVWVALELARGLWQGLEAVVWVVVGFECLAAGQLWREGRGVVEALEAGEMELARARLGRIVGRDTSVLTEEGICRALIESLAENFNDAVVAPLLYLMVGGAVAATIHKAASTMDSMVGFYNDRYRYLGRVPARMDDLLAFVPARIAAVAMVMGAGVIGLEWREGWRAMVRDHRLHRSPNAGWCEASAAGVLGVRLGGPGVYWGQVHERPWLYPEGNEPTPAHARAMLRLLWVSTALVAASGLAVVWIAS